MALLEFVTSRDFGTDLLLFRDAVLSSQTQPYPNLGRLKPPMTLDFGALAIALLLARRPCQDRTLGAIFSLLATAPLLSGMLGLYGPLVYFLPNQTLTTLWYPLAPPTAAGIILLSAGTLALRPDLGWVRCMLANGRRGWATAGLAAAAVLMIAVGIDRAHVERELYDLEVRRQLSLEILLSTLKDAETGQRGFLLTGKQQSLEPYEAARARLSGDLSAAMAALRPAPAANRLHDLVDTKMAISASTIALRMGGNVAGAIELEDSGRGMAAMDAIRAEVDHLSRQATADAVAFRQRYFRALAVAALGILGLLALALANLAATVRARRDLASSEERLRLAVEGTGLATWDHDLSTHTEIWSARHFALFDYPSNPAGPVTTDMWRNRIHPDDLPIVEAANRRGAATGEPFRVTYRIGTGDKERWVESFGRCMRDQWDGRPRRSVGVSVDVTERHAAMTALAASQHRLQIALEAAGMGTWTLNLTTSRFIWDTRQYELFNLAQPVGEVTIQMMLACIRTEDRPRIEAKLARILTCQDDTFSDDLCVVRPDGTVRWLRSEGRVVRLHNDSVQQMAGISYDVTDTVMAREIRVREAAALERLAEERGAALADSEARLVQAAKMEALGRLAGGIAHDFNNVLQAVQTGLNLAATRVTGDPEAAQRYLCLVSNAVERGAMVTGRLLSFARRDALQAEPLAAAALLSGLAEFLAAALGPEIKLGIEVPSGLPPLLANPGQLETVLTNLANNARDAMPAGGRLILRAEALSVPEAVQAPAELAEGVFIRLSVVDEGEGMTQEVLARVREPFFTTKRKGKGTGLGLAMAHSFAEQSGGALTIETALGKGTTVSLWLPRALQGGIMRTREAEAALPANVSPGATSLLV